MKRLVVCSDGTWNRREATARGARPTNVAEMAHAVTAEAPDGTRQLVFYDPGVGTSGSLLRRAWAGVTGQGLEDNVVDAYRFLVDYHEAGDEVYLFGFSRGAFTARSVVGMVRKCGLVRGGDEALLHEAYRFYRGSAHPDDEEAVAFRRQNSKDAASEVPVRFIGVWDTVGALGIPWGPLRAFNRRRHSFHDVRLSKIVETARHAVAIDERRRNFEPALWESKAVPGQSVEQAWFPGVHCGVGGGYRDAGLSDAAFLWVKEAAQAAGLAFDEAYVRKRFLPDAKAPLVESRKGIWLLLPGRWRPIGDADHQPQTLHASALERHGDPASRYAPPNLVEHLSRQAPGTVPAPKPRRRRAAPA